MPVTRVLHVELPTELADLVELKVERGEYASASGVVEEGLRVLQDRDECVERWLKEEVVKAHDEYRADPASAIDSSEVRDRIERLYREHAGKR